MPEFAAVFCERECARFANSASPVFDVHSRCNPLGGQMAGSAIEFHRQWIAQCEAARQIRHRFGLISALEYLVGEKLLHFVDACDQHPDFRQELPWFVAEIKRVFSLTEVGNYAVQLERTRALSGRQRATVRAVSSISTHIH